MRAYIKQTDETSLFYQARVGFIKLGYECIYYTEVPNDITKDDIVVGYISDVHKAYEILGVPIPESIDYPLELESFLARKIKKVEYKEIPKDTFPYFIKPINHKQFPGRVIKEFKDLIGVPEVELYYTEDILQIMSEYRVYINNRKIVGIKNYKGLVEVPPNTEIIYSMIGKYKNQPSTYTLDVGVVHVEGYGMRTILIEANNGYSVGNYGLGEVEYAKFLRDGFKQYL